MSTDKEKLNEIAAKIEELTIKLAKATEELKTVSSSMKTLGASQPAQPAPAPAQPTQTPPAPMSGSELRTLDDIRMSFPEELESLLGFEDKGDYIMIKPKAFLGTNFAKIASTAKGMGGEYISAGKESHFRVPKKKA